MTSTDRLPGAMSGAQWAGLLAVVAVLVAGAVSSEPPVDTAAAQPSVVFILADDLGWADVGFHDGPFDTPRLDALANESLELRHHYVQPVCSPTRAELLTGRRASRLGLIGSTNRRVLAPGQQTLPGVLRAAGYATAIAGKWHLGSHPDWSPNRFGFERSYGALAGGLDPYDHKYRGRRHNWFRDGERIREEGHVTDLIAAQAVQWIERADAGPFFLYLPFTAVHTPHAEPAERLAPYADRFPNERKRLYAASVTHLDAAVGQVLDAIDRSGRRESTVVVFASDNGAVDAAHNRPLRGAKAEVFEGGVRGPALVRWPGRIAPGVLEAPVAVVDWLPTLATLAGAEPDPAVPLDGVDIGPLLRGEERDAPERTLFFRSTLGSGLRQGKWKLVIGVDGTAFLSDLEADPGERENLADTHPEKRAALERLLAEKEAAEPPPRRDL